MCTFCFAWELVVAQARRDLWSVITPPPSITSPTEVLLPPLAQKCHLARRRRCTAAAKDSAFVAKYLVLLCRPSVTNVSRPDLSLTAPCILGVIVLGCSFDWTANLISQAWRKCDPTGLIIVRCPFGWSTKWCCKAAQPS